MNEAKNITETFEPVQLVADLEGLLTADLVAAKDEGFAKSLVDQFKKRSKLSGKQLYWVGVLIQRSVEGEPEPEKVDLGDFGSMIALFETASKNLKWPKIKLEVNHHPVQLSVAGPKAKKPGTINVTDGGPFGANTWYGRILKTGEWEQPKHVPEEIEDVATLLKSFAADPAGIAAEYGHHSGHCCFCNKQLTTDESTAVGYGPVCAKNFGLPWGKKS